MYPCPAGPGCLILSWWCISRKGGGADGCGWEVEEDVEEEGEGAEEVGEWADTCVEV